MGMLHMADTFHTQDQIRIPETAQACKERLAALQGEISSIRIQIATTDIRRQAEKKTLDAGWYHRAKTALRLKQQEQALINARLAQFNTGCDKPREKLKDAIIEVVRSDFDDQQWASLVQRAKQLADTQGASHG